MFNLYLWKKKYSSDIKSDATEKMMDLLMSRIFMFQAQSLEMLHLVHVYFLKSMDN